MPVSRCHCLGDLHGLGPQAVLDLSEAGSQGEPLHRSPLLPHGPHALFFPGFLWFCWLVQGPATEAWKFALLALTETLASVLFPRVSIELVAFSGGTVWKVLGAH